MKKSLLLVAFASTVGVCTLAPTDAEATFTLRGGADVRPLLGFGGGLGTSSFGDYGWVGLHVAPGVEMLEVLTLEVDFVPLLGVSGGVDSNFLIAPGLRLDLFIAYARASLPIALVDGPDLWFEAAAGISFLKYAYAGLTLDVAFEAEGLAMIGLELGFKFDL